MAVLTQEHFDEKIIELHKRFDTTDKTLTQHGTKLDAIMESVATRKEVHNLVRELKAQGIELDDTKIFAV